MMKLFLFNPTDIFDRDTITERTKSGSSDVRRQLTSLEKMRLIKARSFFKEIEKNGKPAKKRMNGWYLNPEFPFLSAIQTLLIKTAPLSSNEIISTLSKAGKIKLVITAGVFIQDFDSRVDLLVVGDNLSRAKLESAVRMIESEIGRELRYSYFETDDFKYRLDMYDKLVRDILDFNHEIVLDKIGLK